MVVWYCQQFNLGCLPRYIRFQNIPEWNASNMFMRCITGTIWLRYRKDPARRIARHTREVGVLYVNYLHKMIESAPFKSSAIGSERELLTAELGCDACELSTETGNVAAISCSCDPLLKPSRKLVHPLKSIVYGNPWLVRAKSNIMSSFMIGSFNSWLIRQLWLWEASKTRSTKILTIQVLPSVNTIP